MYLPNCPGAAQDVLLLAFLRKGSCNMKEVQEKQRALEREVTSGSWSRQVTRRVTEQLPPRYPATILETSINRRDQINLSSAPAQTLRSPADFGSNGSLRHHFLHMHCDLFFPRTNSSEIPAQNIIRSPLISRSQLLFWCKLAPRNSCSFVPWRI